MKTRAILISIGILFCSCVLEKKSEIITEQQNSINENIETITEQKRDITQKLVFEENELKVIIEQPNNISIETKTINKNIETIVEQKSNPTQKIIIGEKLERHYPKKCVS